MSEQDVIEVKHSLMKKPNLRPILILVLVISSICSYTYLRQVNPELPVVLEEEQVSEFEQEELDKNEVMLPNITLVKKAFEIGRRFLH